MRIDDFDHLLRDSILVADGAMGSMLHEQLGPQRSFDELNASQPDSVFRVHKAYLDAGAQILETNTFGANRRKLAAIGMADRVVEFNHRGVKIAREAREAAAHEVLIAGSIGPLGLAPQVEELPPEEVRDIFREQAAALEERGVDFFILETFSRLDELLAAIEATRSFSRLPIVAELTYSEEGTTFDGTRPREAAEKLKDKGSQVIGANCTIGPQLLLSVLRELAAVNGIQLSAMPNAGFPKRVGDRIVYPRASPEYFARFAREAAALGVRILGGCCGTTPDHIRAMVEALKQLRPAELHAPSARARARAARPEAEENHSTVEIFPPAVELGHETRAPESGLWQKLQAGRFTLSVEIDPPKGVSLERIFAQVDRVVASGHVDAIDINSGTLARVGMDALMLAGALEERGIETIPHLTTRDLNVIGLQAMLLGAWSVGRVRNVLAITGDPPTLGDHPETSGVYEIDSVGLVKLIAHLNQGADWAGKTLGGATNFTIGVALNPVADDLNEEIRRFRAKVEAGAHFAMTQPLFDPAQWQAFLTRMGSKPPIPVLVGIWPLSSYKLAIRLQNEVPGISIPQLLLNELEAAGTRARDCGFALARRMLAWARTELAGAYLIPPFKRYEEILEIFD